MADTTPHAHDRDDARSDDAPPTDAVTDEVKESAVDAAPDVDPTQSGGGSEGTDAPRGSEDVPDEGGADPATRKVDAGSAEETEIEGASS
ncbi:hypothetical protein [Microbacterium caowuchunii]|uniref:Uncharacterized protein n=1 Tax=Microbacterium caowuchunii TaxID=2614638 RepID=A0A5N0TDH3_9MICO|nr:hypothetical protein [Microbacterium caowuchunii]KAA9133010.1 hypothetical protein F6B40_09950 [Microbacterium caowuchunii]